MTEQPLTDAQIEGALDILPARYRETVRAILLLCRALQRAEKALREIASAHPASYTDAGWRHFADRLQWLARDALPREEGRDG